MALKTPSLADGNGNYELRTLITRMSLLGYSFVYSLCSNTTGLALTTIATGYGNGYSLFNPANSAKTLYVYKVSFNSATGAIPMQLRLTTTDPAYTNTNDTVRNIGGSASTVLSHTWFQVNASIPAAPGNLFKTVPSLASTTVGSLETDELLTVPPGNGICLYNAAAAAGGGSSFYVSISGFEI